MRVSDHPRLPSSYSTSEKFVNQLVEYLMKEAADYSGLLNKLMDYKRMKKQKICSEIKWLFNIYHYHQSKKYRRFDWLREGEKISYFHYCTRVQYETVLVIGGWQVRVQNSGNLRRVQCKNIIKMDENFCNIYYKDRKF